MVVAHPDDEILWFSSVVDKVGEVIVCFQSIAGDPTISDGRKLALKELPLANVSSLGLVEGGVYNSASWPNPILTEYGVWVNKWNDCSPSFSSGRYRQNYHDLVDGLRKRLDGATRVFTHNPWGEYGHEEHVQVFLAVQRLQVELGFELLFSNYVSQKSFGIMSAYESRLSAPEYILPTNRGLLDLFREIYERNQCWTWYKEYVPGAQEAFFSWSKRPVARSSLRPITLIHINWTPRPIGVFLRLLRIIMERIL